MELWNSNFQTVGKFKNSAMDKSQNKRMPCPWSNCPRCVKLEQEHSQSLDLNFLWGVRVRVSNWPGNELLPVGSVPVRPQDSPGNKCLPCRGVCLTAGGLQATGSLLYPGELGTE